ncbi:hypothetical protein FGO68_gene10501 [Halteria grandinella]|uniref:Uncharacterized protein n=1 Tax=Halteria grandinella TaxID=5974 RepID=A0A8J8T6U7_HALGN|nr:hypothetical protein FGO68_gene10501 [Halteria grandinella]
MTSKINVSLQTFLKYECHLEEEDSITSATAFLERMGFKSREQLLEVLPKITENYLTKLGLPENQAAAIMRHSKNAIPIQTCRIFPRLISKYLALQIVGCAYVQPEAIDISYLCSNARLFFIKNFQLFKQNVLKAEKKEIKSVFELLDERWLSKRYRLYYISKSAHYIDTDKDITDCLELLQG